MSDRVERQIVHATTVALGHKAALLRGASGSGKSDLALRFLAGVDASGGQAGARLLVADDQTVLSIEAGQVVASAPQTIRGKIEVRGVGIVEVASAARATVVVVVDLVSPREVERLPEPAVTSLLGVDIPCVRLAPFEVSAPLKLALLLQGAGVLNTEK